MSATKHSAASHNAFIKNAFSLQSGSEIKGIRGKHKKNDAYRIINSEGSIITPPPTQPLYEDLDFPKKDIKLDIKTD